MMVKGIEKKDFLYPPPQKKTHLVFFCGGRFFSCQPWLQEIRPRLPKLRAELQKNILEESCVRDGTADGVTHSRLLNVIQASDEELSAGLRSMEAVQFKHNWFVLEQNYQMKILTYLLRFFDENSWPLDCVKKQESIETLKDLVNEEILCQVFDIYCAPLEGAEEEGYSLDKDKVCRFFGVFLLFPGTNFTVDEFLDMWQKVQYQFLYE